MRTTKRRGKLKKTPCRALLAGGFDRGGKKETPQGGDSGYEISFNGNYRPAAQGIESLTIQEAFGHWKRAKKH
jgi:hypothetical protein